MATTAEYVLAVPDAQADTDWPHFHSVAANEYYAMRLVVMCERGTDDWGLAPTS